MLFSVPINNEIMLCSFKIREIRIWQNLDFLNSLSFTFNMNRSWIRNHSKNHSLVIIQVLLESSHHLKGSQTTALKVPEFIRTTSHKEGVKTALVNVLWVWSERCINHSSYDMVVTWVRHCSCGNINFKSSSFTKRKSKRCNGNTDLISHTLSPSTSPLFIVTPSSCLHGLTQLLYFLPQSIACRRIGNSFLCVWICFVLLFFFSLTFVRGCVDQILFYLFWQHLGVVLLDPYFSYVCTLAPYCNSVFSQCTFTIVIFVYFVPSTTHQCLSVLEERSLL